MPAVEGFAFKDATSTLAVCASNLFAGIAVRLRDALLLLLKIYSGFEVIITSSLYQSRNASSAETRRFFLSFDTDLIQNNQLIPGERSLCSPCSEGEG